MGLLSKLFGAPARSDLALPKKADPLRGWTNLGLYEVHGVNPKTGRQNKKTCQCLSESEARAWALTVGLLEPISVSEIENRKATPEQIKLCLKKGIKANFAELSIVDASALIWYKLDGDKRKINAAEWSAACAAGYPVSALCGPTFYAYIMDRGDWRFREDE